MEANYKLEDVDPQERIRQRALTDALWSTLLTEGVKSGTPGRIECYFEAPSEEAAIALLAGFPDWDRFLTRDGEDSGKIPVKLVSPLVRLSKDAFLELVDVSLDAAGKSTCVFDGFQVDVSSLPRKPWWKFW